MKKNTIIFLVIIVLSIVLVVYLIASTKLITVEQATENYSSKPIQPIIKDLPEIDQKQLEENYKNGAKEILNDFEIALKRYNASISATSSNEITPIEIDEELAPGDKDDLDEESALSITEEISGYKIDLMDLNTPDHLRELHLSLVLAFSDIKEAILNETYSSNHESVEVIKKLKKENPWLVD